ncbi:MAG: hypothetical protein ACSLFC_03140 [Desulfuromonadales bacterium]
MNGKKSFILCVCQGTCPSFTKMDIFGVLSDAQDFSVLIRQLLADT